MGTKQKPLEPWDRQAQESGKAYAAFIEYRDMGIERTTRKVAEKVGKNVSLIQRWSRAHGWVDRVAAWDQDLDRQARAAQIRAIRDMNDRHARTAVVLQTKAAERLRELQPSELSPETALRYIAEAVKLERVARGEPETITEERRRADEREIQRDLQDFIADPGFIRALQDAAAQVERTTPAGGDAGALGPENNRGPAMAEAGGDFMGPGDE